MKRERRESFAVQGGRLVRQVTPARCEPYVHRCPVASYQELASVAEECGKAGFTVEDLAAHAELPMTRAAVALAFWKERGCVVIEHHRNHPASTFLYEDAMIEYSVLESSR